MWRYTGRDRPPFATPPGPGQESVWDYPRPPRVEPDAREVVIVFAGVEVARSRRALRVLETASPPTFYVPLADLRPGCLIPGQGHSYCEYKGRASYWTLKVGARSLPSAAWSYPDPAPDYEVLIDHVGFYPAGLVCTVGGAPVRPQPGRYYAGWVTPEIVGPFKGEPGSEGW